MPHDIRCGCTDCLRSTTGETAIEHQCSVHWVTKIVRSFQNLNFENGCRYLPKLPQRVSFLGDPLRLSSTRISEYRALASPNLIALSSPDPLLTAFQLSGELRDLTIAEPESSGEYLKLRRQVERCVSLFRSTCYKTLNNLMYCTSTRKLENWFSNFSFWYFRPPFYSTTHVHYCLDIARQYILHSVKSIFIFLHIHVSQGATELIER